MSKLFYTEAGHGQPNMSEELTTFRRARKVLDLPATSKSATVYALMRAYPDSKVPLRFSVNGREIATLPAMPMPWYRWYQFTVEAKHLRRGENVFELWCDATAMNAWSIGLESGYEAPRSFISDNSGAEWRNHHMGYLNTFRAEYILRVRLEDGQDAPPPPFKWEDPGTARMESLRRVIPEAAKGKGSSLEKAQAIMGWLSSNIEHANTVITMQNAPWDPETVFDWGSKQRGHNGMRPLVHCVHFSATFVSCAQAVGIPARCAVFTNQQPDGWFGHFTAEFWSAEQKKWAMVDPQGNACFMRNDSELLSIAEVQQVRPELAKYTKFGEGIESQKKNPRLKGFIFDRYPVGTSFKHRSTWYRSDLLTNPIYNPPAHGSTAYCETGLVWDEKEKDLFGMFPHFGDEAYFSGAPVGFPG
ncbi:MAG: transglutaminase domain-containing protein [SAR202 cluster bacterium]|nr:transglutaminase domain-containing protein [SAR202 cluster bacterium]